MRGATLTEPATQSSSLQPRWKSILDQLRTEVPRYSYGSRFYTIADICAKFDVSAITARRVLTELQREGLVEKIPKRGTVIRRVARTMTLRWIVPAEARPTYFTETSVLMRQYAGVTGTAIANEADFAPIPEARVTEMYADRSDHVGFIVPNKVRRATIDFLLERKLHCVLIDPTFGYKVPGVSSVGINRPLAGYLSARYLIDQGHDRIAFVLGSIASPHFRQRLNGYRKALKEAGIPYRWPLIHETDSKDQWFNDNAMNMLMDLRPRPTAVITGDDDRAIWILKYCKTNGIRVGALTGGRSSPECAKSFPESIS